MRVADWPVHRKVCALTELLAIPGYADDEIAMMVDTVEKHRPCWIFEWGTNRGSSARIFYEATRLAQIPCDIHTTELPDDIEYHEHPQMDSGLFVRGLPHVHQHRGDGLSVSLMLARMLPRRNTLFFVDGDHSFEAVVAELRAIRDALPYAWVLVHDTGHAVSGAREAVERVTSESRRDGDGGSLPLYTVTWCDTPVGMARLAS